VLYFIYNYFERYNTSLKLEASAKEIELNNLKSQLNPHFIFNALNSIRALVDEICPDHDILPGEDPLVRLQKC
jgi:sensor histidine kinase YesM